MGQCYLAGVTPCQGKISREHVISKGVLNKLFSGGKGLISGTPWSSTAPKAVSVESFASKILCEGHNSSLSPLDSEMGTFLECLQSSQNDLANKSTLSLAYEINGNNLERWLLKFVLGMQVSNNFANSGDRLPEALPEICKRVLVGGSFPTLWGLYLQPTNQEFAMSDKEFWCEPMTGNGFIRAARFSIARIPFCLVLGKPDQPSFWGKFHPTHINLKAGSVERTFHFNWENGPASGGVSFVRLRDS